MDSIEGEKMQNEAPLVISVKARIAGKIHLA
jgi:hypothetical protein